MVNLSNHPSKILSAMYPSVGLPSIFIRHINNQIDKLIANIALEPVTSTFTLVTETTTATVSSFESVAIKSEGMHSYFCS